MSIDNQIMSEIYPYGGFWAYLKYHFIDGFTKQSTMFMDKTKVNYGGSESKSKKKSEFKKDETISTQEKMESKLLSMGIGGGRKKEKTNAQRAEEIYDKLND